MIGFIALLFGRKTTTLSAAPAGSSTTIRVWQPFMPGPDQPYCYIENGHTFYVWPAPNAPIFLDAHGNIWEFPGMSGNALHRISEPLAFDLPKFSRHAFTLESPRLTPDEQELFFNEVNRMRDRWTGADKVIQYGEEDLFAYTTHE